MPQTEPLNIFMQRANALYYKAHNPFDDFTTSPEICQVFGELIGLWGAVTLPLLSPQPPGTPEALPFILAEAGPGRGTLMKDALRALHRADPDFAAKLSVHLIETSETLQEIQKNNVPTATFHQELRTLPEGKLLLIANEFLDALPVRQFIREKGQIYERLVCFEKEKPESAYFTRSEAPVSLPEYAPVPLKDGEISEYSEAQHFFIRQLAERLKTQGGIALFIDYGPRQSAVGDTLQALYRKKPVHPLSVPAGEADLTAHVHFSALMQQARSCGLEGRLTTQKYFLTELGLTERMQILLRNKEPKQAQVLAAAADRLIASAQMGDLFKVLLLFVPNTEKVASSDSPLFIPGFSHDFSK